MQLQTFCLVIRTRRFLLWFGSRCGPSFGACSPPWSISVRRLRVLPLLLLLFALFSRISLALLFLLLLLSSCLGSRGSALPFQMQMLVWLLFFPQVALTFRFSLLVTLHMLSGEFASGQAAPVNPSLLSLFEKQLKPSHHVGLTNCEAAALESSLRSQSEALSHSIWVLSVLFGFVRLQNFAPADSSLFNMLITSLSKSLAHQATLRASHTAFLVLKCRQFYLSHLPVYFSEVNMLAAPAVCSDFLFAEPDVARLSSDTQTSLRSQQALVDVASRSTGARPRRLLARQSPSGRRRRESGSPSRGSKRVRSLLLASL